MGDKTPAEDARPGWVRPGDEIARQAAEPPGDTEAVPEGVIADAPEVFFGPEGSPADWEWRARLVVVFADTPQNSAFLSQIRELESNVQALIDRDAVVVVDTDPAAASEWRRVLRPEGFALMLIDMDGTVMLRKPVPWGMREISRAIDRFPARRQELGRSGSRP